MLLTGKIIQIIDIKGFRRIIFESDGINYSDFSPGMYIKIQYGNDDEAKFRSITVSQNDGKSIGVDFVVHSKPGPAADWQRLAKVGDEFKYKGPGPASRCDYNAEEFFFHADASSLPAMTAHLKNLENDKKVYLFFDGESEIIHEYLDLKMYYFFNDLEGFKQKLAESRFDHSAVWLAGEKGSISSLRELIKDHCHNALSVYTSSYWKKDATDEEHRLEKKAERAKKE